MQTLKTGVSWLDTLMPEGLPLNTTTLISGPGGSGKPLIGDNFVAAWLRNGGSAVFMSLQYPSTDFIYESLKSVASLDLRQYQKKTAFISLDVSIDGLTPPEGNVFRANMVRPAIWDAALEQAYELVPDEGPGIMVFSSAINLLLFSPTYGEAILHKMELLFQEEKKTHTYVFSASTTAKKDEIARLEQLADNLIMARSEKKPFRLFMRIIRLRGVRFSNEEIPVPIPPRALAHVKDIAEHSRKRVIPQISRI